MRSERYVVSAVLAVDLDGTVRRSASGRQFIDGPDDVELYPGAEERLWRAADEGYVVVGVSNQGGVAHGFKTEDQVRAEVYATVRQFRNNPFCMVLWAVCDPAGSAVPFGVRSLQRKPHYGMLAVAEWRLKELGVIVDWDRSLVVGDRDEDMLMARDAGVGFEWAHAYFGREPG